MRDVERILEIRFSINERNDSFFWSYIRRRVYTLKSAHHMMCSLGDLRANDDTNLWKRLWQLKISEKMKHFGWRVITDCVPVLTRLQRKGVQLGCNLYPICKSSPEIASHSFLVQFC